MTIVIVGAGRIGSRLVDLALDSEERVVLIETDHVRCEDVREQWPDIEVIHGDATHTEILERAGVPDVKGLLATTREDPTNLMVCLLAREMGTERTVALVNAPEARSMFEGEHIDIVGNPSHLAAETLYRGVQDPQISNFMRLGDGYEVVSTRMPDDSPLAGKAVKDAGFGPDVLVSAIRRGERVILPRGEFVLRGGDELTVVKPTHAAKTLFRRIKRTTGLDQLFR